MPVALHKSIKIAVSQLYLEQVVTATEDFEVLARTEFGEAIRATPAISGGRVT